MAVDLNQHTSQQTPNLAAPLASELLCPLFVVPGSNVTRPIASLPGHQHLSLDTVVSKAAALADLGIGGVLLFGLPEERTNEASSAFGKTALVQSALRRIKETVPSLRLIADLCLCQYNNHGHCGVFRNGILDNDQTLAHLERLAVELAESGADVLMPSGMVDGAVGHIRQALNQSGFRHVKIMSQAVKYASALYGPFREAAHISDALGKSSKEAYQIDPANRAEALHEIALDVAEGADMVMVKPAFSYGDVIRAVTKKFTVPVAAFSTSGEYGMIYALAAQSESRRLLLAQEMAASCKRAGATLLVTYFAEALARLPQSSQAAKIQG